MTSSQRRSSGVADTHSKLPKWAKDYDAWCNRQKERFSSPEFKHHLRVLKILVASIFMCLGLALMGGLQSVKFNFQVMAAVMTSSALIDAELDDEAAARAIDAMLKSLDRKSGVRSPSYMTERKNFKKGRPMGSLGFLVGGNDGRTVTKIYEGGAAEAAGLAVGDRVVSFMSAEVSDGAVRLQQVMDVTVRGAAPGETIGLSVERDGEVVDLVLTPIRTQGVSAHGLGVKQGILRIVLSEFEPGSGDEVRKIIERAQEEGEVKGVLFDMRGNPGGPEVEQVRLAELFVPKGTIIGRSNGRRAKENLLKTERKEVFPGIASVGLVVDSHSASASEGFAAAVQDLGLGPVGGEITYGKGSSQWVFDFIGVVPFAVTVERFTGPVGEKIDGVGVKPDLFVEGEDGLRDWGGLIKAVEATMREQILLASVSGS